MRTRGAGIAPWRICIPHFVGEYDILQRRARHDQEEGLSAGEAEEQPIFKYLHYRPNSEERSARRVRQSALGASFIYSKQIRRGGILLLELCSSSYGVGMLKPVSVTLTRRTIRSRWSITRQI